MRGLDSHASGGNTRRTDLCGQATSTPPIRPQIRLIDRSGSCGAYLLAMNGGLESPPQPGMLNAQNVLLENGLSPRIIERPDRLTNFFARTAKEGRGRRPPLPTERVNSIRNHQHRDLVVGIPRNREPQKKEQPFANLPGSP